MDDERFFSVEQLFKLYADDVYHFALYMLNNSIESEDVVQEVFLRVVRRLETLKKAASVKSWIFTIANNCVKDTLRKRRKYNGATSVEYIQLPGRELESLIEIQECIFNLPMDQKQVAILRLVEDLSTKETASALGWSELKVRQVLHRAYKTLRIFLRDNQISMKGM